MQANAASMRMRILLLLLLKIADTIKGVAAPTSQSPCAPYGRLHTSAYPICTECSRSKAEQRRTPASHRIQERRKPMPCTAMNHFPTYPRRSGGIVFVITLVLSGLVDPIVGEPSMPGRRVFLPVPAPPGYIPGKPSSAPADRQSESLSLPLCGSGCLPRFWTFRPILGAPATAL